MPDKYIIMSIDPGSDNLGYSIVKYSNKKKILLSWGTISISNSKADAPVSGFISVMDQLIKIWDTFTVNIVTIEDYTIYGGKYTGSTVVPSLIYLISYEWYRRYSKIEVIRIPLTVWKSTICNNKSADKLEIIQSVSPQLDIVFPGTNKKIHEYYESLKYEYQKEGIQDCYDSLGQMLYVLAMADICYSANKSKLY